MNDPTNADEDFTADLVTETDSTVDFVLLEDSVAKRWFDCFRRG